MRRALRFSRILLVLLVGAFITGAIAALLPDPFSGTQQTFPIGFFPMAGTISAAGLLVLPWTAWEMVRPFFIVCTSRDHISEIVFPVLVAGPPFVFALVCAASAFLLRKFVSLGPRVAISVPTALLLFLPLRNTVVAALTQLHNGCPPF